MTVDDRQTILGDITKAVFFCAAVIMLVFSCLYVLDIIGVEIKDEPVDSME